MERQERVRPGSASQQTNGKAAPSAPRYNQTKVTDADTDGDGTTAGCRIPDVADDRRHNRLPVTLMASPVPEHTAHITFRLPISVVAVSCSRK